mmetsp:Transcript_135285/g.201196  ORF Transcript_135285/g.201196 Transcript_135285/m.201196 type:complete len:558 (+) Transcript_135285:16-1689(+)
MRVAGVAFVVICFASVCFAFEGIHDLVTMEQDTRAGVPYQWSIVREATKSESIDLIIPMKTKNFHMLDSILADVSTPSSPNYGKYWSKERVNKFLAPPQENFDRVFAWLLFHKISDFEILADRFVKVHTTIGDAEKLLSVVFHELQHDATGYSVLRSINHYKVPHAIAEVIQVVGGVIRIPKLPRKLNLIPGGTTNPEVIQQMYNITIPASSTGNLQAVASFLGQYYSPSDLTDFEKEFSLPLVPIAETYGPNDSSDPGIEASLDVQYLLGISNCSIPTWVISTPSTTPSGNEPFLTFLSGLSNLTQIPNLISMSYQDYEYTVSESYANACNQEFMAYSLQGTTFITGSGDWGVGCIELGQCSTFTADFPSSSPYVISTGATTFNEQGAEIGVSFSSGGFSNYFARPSFQDTAVNAFLAQSDLPPSSYYNSSGRGFPDISTIGTGFVVYTKGVHNPVGGTSAATPTFGSILSMINSNRIAAGQPVLGYALPFIYQAWSENDEAFLDITESQLQDEGCCGGRFDTVPGWDPYTGLGTPNYSVLLELAMSSTLFPSLAK